MNPNKDDSTPGDEWVIPPQEPDAPPGPARHHTAARLFALAAASVVVGAGASYVANNGGDSTASAGTANEPAAVSRSNGAPPGRFGEQHVQGAVTARPDGETD